MVNDATGTYATLFEMLRVVLYSGIHFLSLGLVIGVIQVLLALGLIHLLMM